MSASDTGGGFDLRVAAVCVAADLAARIGWVLGLGGGAEHVAERFGEDCLHAPSPPAHAAAHPAVGAAGCGAGTVGCVMFAEAVAADPNTPVDVLAGLAGHGQWFVRKAVAANPSLPVAVLAGLAEDDDWSVRKAVAANPHTSSGQFGKIPVSTVPNS